jgi:hypothetical protein
MNIMASFDGAGAQAEYIRKGCNWKGIEENFKHFISSGGSNINIYPVMSVLNSFHITKAIDSWIESGIISEKSQLCIPNFVTEKPKYYNIRIFNHSERERLRGHYLFYLMGLESRTSQPIYHHVKSYLDYVLKFLEGGLLPVQERREFRRITNLLDKERSENFGDLFPELSSLFEESDQEHEL